MSPAQASSVESRASLSSSDALESLATSPSSDVALDLETAPSGVDHSTEPSDLHGHALGLGSGLRISGEANTTSATNGHAVTLVNGHRGVLSNGHSNGHTHGHSNGHAAAHPNGHANGHANGHSNGHANGHSNGHAVAYALSERSLGDVAHLLGAAPLVQAVGVRANGTTMPVTIELPAPATLPAERTTPAGLYLKAGKRALDLIGGAVAALLFAPVVLVAAMAVKLTSRGPAFYRSTRLGKDGRPFTFYKLRSMYVGADAERAMLMHLNEADGPVFKLRYDPRVTRVGQWIRSTSIDELPQILNVLKGDMSLVGPRPPLPEEAERYESWQRARLDVKPGITCLWQVSGRSRLGFNEWMRLDLEYIRRQSFATDVWILVRTIPAVVSREGAY